MSATVRMICGPALSGKTARLRQLWLERARGAPGSALWLAPTGRAAEQARAAVVRSAGSVVGLRFVAFTDFLDEVVRCNDPQVRPLTDVQRRLLAEDLVANFAARKQRQHFDGFSDSRGFVEGLLDVLEGLRRAGASPKEFADSAKRGGFTARQCAALFNSYERALRRRRLLDGEGRAWHARDLLRRGLCHPYGAVRSAFLDGFADFTPAESSVLEVLATRLNEIWISLVDETGDERAELFSRPRQTIQQLRAAGLQVGLQADTVAANDKRPAGLVHLERQLFRPPRRVEPEQDAFGIEVIEAPGDLGEMRLVARRVRTLLAEGVPPDTIVVAARDLPAYADVAREVLEEYAIAADIEGSEPLTRDPVVAVLLRAARLPDEDWPFAGVTALLRHTYFRPRWDGVSPEIWLKAEALLRLLGEPRGRDAYLRSVDRWAREPQPGLEDEQAEESRRLRTHQLAGHCGPFLHRFFRAWDGVPDRATLAAHFDWLRAFTDDLGIAESARVHGSAALALLFDELARWKDAEPERVVDRRTFLRRLGVLAGCAGLPRTPRGSGRVRVLSAAQARHLDADYLFVVGLGERGFPRLAPAPTILDEAERLALAPLGLSAAGPAELLPDEMLLFYQVVTRARRRLVLSYPAVDPRGQPLLAGSFLTAVLGCFRPGAIPVERRAMLLEGYDRDAPMSAAEYRVRVAAASRDGGCLGGLGGDLAANLADAAELVRHRFRERTHNRHDGLFRDPAAIAQVAETFGPEHIFSPTALEDYVACPFKFFLRHALRLQPLEEPREGVQVTRRGQAVHRALARLHRRLKDDAIHLPTEAVPSLAREEVARAVEEDVRRAPSRASQELWRLEGQRLMRLADRYGSQWQRFVGPWLEKGVVPRPHHFEVDFGIPSADGSEPHGPLVVRADGLEVRVSGRIDRVDLAELPDGTVGYFIIDYKTGRSTNYTGSDLANFRKLQLTLYALAVDEVLLAGRQARPLGLAYWLVGEQGPKVALPVRNEVLWLTESEKWRGVRETLRAWVGTLVRHIRTGAFPLRPRSEKCAETCDFGEVCRIAQARTVEKPGLLELPAVPS